MSIPIRGHNLVAGDKHPRTKVTAEQREEIIGMRMGGKSLGVIAWAFDISRTRVSQICKNAFQDHPDAALDVA